MIDRRGSRAETVLQSIYDHSEFGWRMNAGYDYDYRDYKIVADDLRSFARYEFATANDTNDLCVDLLETAASRLDEQAADISFWAGRVADKFGANRVKSLKDRVETGQAIKCPTPADLRRAQRIAITVADVASVERDLKAQESYDAVLVGYINSRMTMIAEAMENANEWQKALIEHSETPNIG